MNEELSKEQKALLHDINIIIKNSYTFITAMDMQRSLVSPDTNVDNARALIKRNLDTLQMVLQMVNPVFN